MASMVDQMVDKNATYLTRQLKILAGQKSKLMSDYNLLTFLIQS